MVGLTHFYPKELMVLITSKTNGPNIIKTRVKFHMYISGFNYMAVSFVTEYKLPNITELSVFAEDTLPLIMSGLTSRLTLLFIQPITLNKRTQMVRIIF